jgi:hypothetical protein
MVFGCARSCVFFSGFRDKAEDQTTKAKSRNWIPVFAGMTR